MCNKIIQSVNELKNKKIIEIKPAAGNTNNNNRY